MNKQTLSQLYDYLDCVHITTMVGLAAFNDEELSFKPTTDMFSVTALVHHAYSNERILAESVHRGGFEPALQLVADGELAGLDGLAAVREYAQSCHQTARNILADSPEGTLARIMQLPPSFGPPEAPGWRFFALACEEHVHHRGQFSVYMRLLGKGVLGIF